MENIIIRKASEKDISNILPVYEYARKFMTENGNPNQWGTTYPEEELLCSDIEKGTLFVIEKDGLIHGVFVFYIGEDSAYSFIENGSWLSDGKYGVIHRIAGDGKLNNIFGAALSFCKSKIKHLRIDTHGDNKIMQHIIEKHGFKKCGTVYYYGNSPRIAYEKL